MQFIEVLFQISWQCLKTGSYFDKLMVLALWLPWIFDLLTKLYALPSDFMDNATYFVDHVLPVLQSFLI